MSNTRTKYYDNHTLYVTSGVAREEQLYRALQIAIQNGEDKLNNEVIVDFLTNQNREDIVESVNNLDLSEQNKILRGEIEKLGFELPEEIKLECNIKVNLIVNKNGEYYGFGYIRVSNESVYWMLLGRNPDGTERILEYPDPDWISPLPKPPLSFEEEQAKYNEMSWYDIAQEEDKYIHPMIKEDLGPLMSIPGYKYDEMQYRHLQEMAVSEGKDPSKVPTMGYFEFARAYARDADDGKMSNVLCARQVPDWIPTIAFKNIFKIYASNSDATVRRVPGSDGDFEEVEESYPFIEFINGKKDSCKIVFITFDPSTNDAIFSLLMTRKVRIVHPKRSDLRCTLIFDHAYEHGKTQIQSKGYKNNDQRRISRDRSPRNRDQRDRQKSRTNTGYKKQAQGFPRDDVDISKYNYTKR